MHGILLGLYRPGWSVILRPLHVCFGSSTPEVGVIPLGCVGFPSVATGGPGLTKVVTTSWSPLGSATGGVVVTAPASATTPGAPAGACLVVWVVLPNCIDIAVFAWNEASYLRGKFLVKVFVGLALFCEILMENN